jgi:pimeloyl-ACP methyl ester carboxylesterase
MDNLARDAAELVEAPGAAPCHFAGLSMGGFVAMRLAAWRPDLFLEGPRSDRWISGEFRQVGR